MSSDFEKMIWPLRHGLFRFAISILQNSGESEDVVQEVMLRLYKMMENSDHVLKPKSLAYTMVRNACYDHLKKASNRYESNGISGAALKHSYLENGLERKETMDAIHRAIGTLKPERQEVFILREIEGHSYSEIEELTGINNKNLRVQISRARKKLRQILSSYEYHE